MSGIAGILHRDGRPVDGADLRAMTDTMTHRGPDGIEQHVAGPLGMAHCLLRTLPDPREKLQPAWDQRGEICLTLDGRIDNRQELRLGLGSAARNIRDDTDAELLICAYQHWEDACIARVIGDFSFALWDGRLRRLVCARDFLGKRPFYSHYDGSTFRWASEPQAVLADRSIPRVPNEGMIGEYLSANVRSTTETLFRDLFRLAPARFLVLGVNGLRISRYWIWAPGSPISHRDERDYAGHLRELCADAVEVRLESSPPAVVELSGGVDSSSLVGMIEHLDRVEKTETYSLVFPGWSCDETDHIRAVVRHCRVPNHEIKPAPVATEAYDEQARQYLDLADYPNTMMHRPLWQAARDRGSRVVLTGSGPDDWLVGSPYSYASSLRHLQLRRLSRDVRSEASVWGWRAALGELWHLGLRPQAPPWLRQAAGRAPGRTPCPFWLHRSFVGESGLSDRLRAASVAGDPVSHMLDDGWRAHATESGERALASVGMQGRDPFDDRRVVEYALGLPEDQRRRGHVTKYALREAVSGMIPESVRTRSDKADYHPVFCEELRLHGGPALFQSMALEDLGWVDGARVRGMYDAYVRSNDARDAHKRGEYLWPLWLINSVERWLRAL
ncbi:MAG: asparagine synthase-related protein [Solirubrobacteraceae bacterium]